MYLIDDLPAELDFESAKRLFTLLSQRRAQVFASAITDEAILAAATASSAPIKVFHVKHQALEERAM